MPLLLRDLNGEPERAEVHYMPGHARGHRHYFEQIRSPHLKWAFTINHAHYDPIGIKGFIDGMDMSRCEEVRIADNNGLYELHMHPAPHRRLRRHVPTASRRAGFRGHYMCGWGSRDDMLLGRDYPSPVPGPQALPRPDAPCRVGRRHHGARLG